MSQATLRRRLVNIYMVSMLGGSFDLSQREESTDFCQGRQVTDKFFIKGAAGRHFEETDSVLYELGLPFDELPK